MKLYRENLSHFLNFDTKYEPPPLKAEVHICKKCFPKPKEVVNLKYKTIKGISKKLADIAVKESERALDREEVKTQLEKTFNEVTTANWESVFKEIKKHTGGVFLGMRAQDEIIKTLEHNGKEIII